MSTAVAHKTKPKVQQPARVWLYKWARWLHVYISTASLLLILFFALTGITLNHPDWAFGTKDVTQNVSGTLPSGWLNGAQVDWLKVAETMRNENGVHGRVSDYFNDDSQGQLSFSSPGYSADVFIDMKAGTYDLTTDSQGFIAVINDLHRGRAGGPAWRWVVDASGIFLSVVALTGLLLLLFLKKLRPKGLLTVLGGSAVAILLITLAVK